MKKKLLCLFALLMTLALSVCLFASCDDGEEEISGGSGGWDEGWGGDDWGDGSYEEYDPSQSYNQIDYSLEYVSYGSVGRVDGSDVMTFDPHQGVFRYEAERATLTGDARVEDSHVGYLDNATVTFNIDASEDCTVLLVASFSTAEESAYGHHFQDQYTLTVNGNDVDTGDCWIKKTAGWTTFTENAVGTFDLTAGENAIEFASAVGQSNFDYILLVPQNDVPMPAFTYSDGMRLQAEETRLEDCKIEYSGEEKIVSWTNAQTSLEFTLNAAAATESEFAVNAVIGTGDDGSLSLNAAERMTLTVNGQAVDLSAVTLSGSSAENWWEGSYTENSLGTISLQSGENVIRVTLSDQCNVNFFRIGMPAFAYTAGMKIEAEDTKYTAAQAEAGGSGTIVGLVSDATTLTFVVDAAAATEAEIKLGALFRVDGEYPAQASERLSLTVNGQTVDLSAATLSGYEGGLWWQNAYGEVSLGTVSLQSGVNTLVLTLSPEMNIDYILLG